MNAVLQALQALRKKIAVAEFDQLMRSWESTHRNGNATTDQFVALSERSPADR